MSTTQTYYLDGSSLETSTTVYQNSDMSLIASDGYYSNGSISRQQIGGILGLVMTCPSCLTGCGISLNRVNEVSLISIINVDVLTNVGPVIITFNPNLLISGIVAEYDGAYYNKLSSPSFGLLGGSPSNKETYLGITSSCLLPVFPASETLPIYKYLDGSWLDTGAVETISISTGQIQTTVSAPGQCVMVIPKPNSNPSNLNIKITSPCADSGYDIQVDCPVSIPSFIGSIRFDSPLDPSFCGDVSLNNYYFVSLTSSITIGLFDWVFADPNAQTLLADGYYKIDPLPYPSYANTIRVQSGIVIDLGLYC